LKVSTSETGIARAAWASHRDQAPDSKIPTVTFDGLGIGCGAAEAQF
jgi:hypothetical protein